LRHGRDHHIDAISKSVDSRSARIIARFLIRMASDELEVCLVLRRQRRRRRIDARASHRR
jgi:hypothetical protein